MSKAYDAIIIGGGHNGLVCAAYLARAGKRVLILEAADRVGGAAITREIIPGFKVSACAHLLYLLHPKVLADLRLQDHGLKLSASEMPTIALAEDGRHLTLSTDSTVTAASLSAHSAADAAALPAFQAQMRRFAGIVQRVLAETPPRLGTRNRSDLVALVKLAWSIRRLGRQDMREFLRIAGMNVADVLEEHFETDLLCGAYAFDAVLGTRLGPRSPNSMLTRLYRLAGGLRNGGGALAHPEGGMGALSEALAASAKRAGASISTGTRVKRILVESDRAAGVVLDSGEEFAANLVVSNADPKRTFLSLLGTEYLDTGFVRRIRDIPTRGTAAKLHLALDGLPSFSDVDRAQLGGRLVIAPSVDYVERAFNHAKYGEYSEAPAIEITIPSLHDSTLAPVGKHVLSAIVQYAPAELKAGWDQAREPFADNVIDTLIRYTPDLKDKIISRELLTPLDLEREFGMTGGHWHHGELGLERFLMLRPVPGAAQYATPLPGLYLCGSGCHPGGGVMGAAGMNAAREVLAGRAAA
ncbi:MAG: phytoene desaturase family protein [Acidiferrobacterales bacterium]